MSNISKRFFVLIVVSFCLFSQINADIADEIDNIACCEDNSVTVIACGSATLKPDITVLTITVTGEGGDLLCATKDLLESVKKVLDYLKNKGIAQADISSKPFLVASESSQIEVQQIITVIVRTVDPLKIAYIVDALKAINGVKSVEFEFVKEDTTHDIKAARKAAIASAKNQARTLAKAAGRELGEVLSIVEKSQSGEAGVPAEELAIQTCLTVKFQLECSE